MKYSALAISFVSTMMLLCPPAHAAHVQAEKIEDMTQDLSIPLSKNPIQVEIAKEQADWERANRPKGALEFQGSSWTPSSLQPYSRLSDTSNFGTTVPSLSINNVTPIGYDLSVVAGLEFAEFSRTGTLNTGGSATSDKQTVYVPALRAGVEYAPVRLANRIFQPYLTAALLPTALITGRSSFDDGESDFGVAGEFSGGTVIHASSSVDLTAAILGVVGKVKSSDLSGYGLSAGVRVPL